MTIKQNTLSNGLKYVIVENNNISGLAILVLVYTGARNENPKYAGISHLLEHMLFRGTDKDETGADIFKKLNSGGGLTNAYTSSDQTGYFVKTYNKNGPLAMNVLSDMIFKSKLDNNNLKKEQKIVIEEINMGNDNPHKIVIKNFDINIFNGHPLSNDIGGDKKTVSGITQKVLKDYYDTHYHPSNIVLVVSGNTSGFSSIDKDINKHFNIKKKNNNISTIYEEMKLYCGGWRLVHSHLISEQDNIVLGFPTFSYHNTPNRYILEVLNVILGGNTSSKLFTRVREQNGLVYRINSSIQIYEDNGFICVKTMCETNKVANVIELIIDIIEEFKSGQISNNDINDAIKNIEGSMYLKSDDTMNTALFYGTQVLYGQPLITMNNYLKEIKNVNKEQIVDLSNMIFDYDRMLICLVGSCNEKKIKETINKKINS